MYDPVERPPTSRSRPLGRWVELARGALVVVSLLGLLRLSRVLRTLGRRSNAVARMDQTWSDLWMR